MTDVRRLVREAVTAFLERDGGLLANDSAERAITHQLAVHLAGRFSEWNVDCEYDRDIEVVKRLKYAIAEGELVEDREVIPDIIIHRRMTNQNLVVLEVKKSTNRESNEKDLRKLQAFREQLGYEYAGFFRLSAGDHSPKVNEEIWIEDA